MFYSNAAAPRVRAAQNSIRAAAAAAARGMLDVRVYSAVAGAAAAIIGMAAGSTLAHGIHLPSAVIAAAVGIAGAVAIWRGDLIMAAVNASYAKAEAAAEDAAVAALAVDVSLAVAIDALATANTDDADSAAGG
jgi:hypothetical protein